MAKKRCGCKHGSGMAKDIAGVVFKEMLKSGVNKIAGPIKPLPKKGGSMKLSLHSIIQRERNKPRYKPPKTISYNKAPKRGGFIFPNIDAFLPKYTARTVTNFRDPYF